MVIEDNTNPDDIEDWDSLNHINWVSAIEQKFQIKFENSNQCNSNSTKALKGLLR